MKLRELLIVLEVPFIIEYKGKEVYRTRDGDDFEDALIRLSSSRTDYVRLNALNKEVVSVGIDYDEVYEYINVISIK